MTTTPPTQIDEQAAEAFTERIFGSSNGAFETLCVYLGDKLGLYRALEETGPLTAPELAEAAGIDARYAREWCEHQATTGILGVDDPEVDADDRRYSLPAEHAAALVDPDGPFSIAPLARAVAACAIVLPQITEAFRTGGGVEWSAFGADMIESQGDFNRPWLRQGLTTVYLPSVPDVHDALTSGARVVDIACGVGWAGVAIAKAYENTTVVGLDPDDSSIALARRNAAEDGVGDRASFEVHDCTRPLPGGPFDLAVVVEALHDVAKPVEVLSRIRESLAPNGTLIVADEKVGESFAEPGEQDGLFYAFSVLCCLPAGRTEEGSAATGTVMRPDTLRSYAMSAGFSAVEVLDQIDHPMLRFYQLSG